MLPRIGVKCSDVLIPLCRILIGFHLTRTGDRTIDILFLLICMFLLPTCYESCQVLAMLCLRNSYLSKNPEHCPHPMALVWEEPWHLRNDGNRNKILLT